MEGYSIWNFSLTSVFLLSAIWCLNCDVGYYKEAACHDHEREALIKFRSGLEYYSYHQVASWDQITGDCCEWRGVECDHQTGYVFQLHLFPDLLRNDFIGDNDYHINKTGRLSGHLDPVLLELEYLRFLDLSGNAFIGMPIPEFLGSFKDLRYLNLSYSHFAGRIPHQLGNLSNLEQLDIRGSMAGFAYALSANSLHWLKGMPMLKTLSMDKVNLSEVGNDWIQVLNDGLPSLHELEFSDCRIGEIASTITPINFNSLRKLNLNDNRFFSKIPSWIANISSLESVDLSWNEFHGPIPHDLSQLPHLKQLNLGQYMFDSSNLTGNCTTLLQGAWRSIESLDFGSNKLYGQLPSSIGNLTSLIFLDLSDNNIEGLPETLTNPCSFVIKGSYCHGTAPLPNLRVLNLGGNRKMSGTIPNWLGKLRSLETLDMGRCNLSGPIPPNFGDLSSLRTLNLNRKMSGTIPNWLGKLRSLEELYMIDCNLSGPIPPNFGDLSSLRTLNLGYNHLSGILPMTTWNLSRLEQLSLGNNWLMGDIADAQLNQLKKLTHLDLSSNSFVLHLASHWVPPFQLKFLNLEACSLGPSFPMWLITQKSLRQLYLSNTSMEDSLPPWFWDFASSLLSLDLSHNKIKGLLPKTWNYSYYDNFDLSNNQFSGPLPQNYFTPLPLFFSVSDNNITGTIPNSICDVGAPQVMNLSQNHIFGSIPAGLGNCTRLRVLDLSENHLAGGLPSSFSKLNGLRSLHLGNNNLSGTISSALSNCSYLVFLDLEKNNLSGNISPLVHNTSRLRILRLRSNKFTGTLPPNISSMDGLQILDLSDNMLSGLIPKSIGEFASLTTKVSTLAIGFTISYEIGIFALSSPFDEKLWMSFKGKDLLYDKILGLVVGIDLSRNDFHGEIPKELTSLKGLIYLNLSDNCFTSAIPENFGELRWLESLDMSGNQLEGRIPLSLVQLTLLSKLNLSNNHLWGMIPSGGQLQVLGDSSIYEGNIGLCGPPLERKCAAIDTVPTTQDLEHGKKDDETRLLYMGMMFGFIFGFWVFWGILIFNKSMRIACCKFFDAMMDMSFLLIVIYLGKGKVKTRG